MASLKRVFEFIKKNIGIIVVVVAVAYGVSFFKNLYWSARYDEAKAIFEMDKAKLQKSIDAKLKESKKWEDEANKERDRANKLAEKNRILLGQKEESDKKRKEAEAKVAKMSPDEVVVETRLELSVKETEIWLTAQGIVFDITSAKKNLVKLRGWAYYTNEIIPEYDALVDGLGDEIISVRKESENLRFSLANCQGAIAGYVDLIKRYDDQLKRCEKLVKIFKWTVGGTVVAVVVGVILYLVLK